MKTCNRCGLEKAETEFYGKDGSCKDCRKAVKAGKAVEPALLDTESTEFHVSVSGGVIHCYDDSDWVAESYSPKLSKFLASVGATEMPTSHDGKLFELNPKQLVGFAILASGGSLRDAKKAVGK